MKKIFLCMFGTLVGISSFGCASHNHVINGRQPESHIPAGVRVGIGSAEVKVGDKVNVLKPACKSVNSARVGPTERCIEKKIGEAIVLNVIDHDSAIVEAQNGLVMDESMKVEKQ